jgi:hypothetical protein
MRDLGHARQAHGHTLPGQFADGPDVMHMLMGVEVAGTQAAVQSVLPLRLQFILNRRQVL